MPFEGLKHTQKQITACFTRSPFSTLILWSAATELRRLPPYGSREALRSLVLAPCLSLAAHRSLLNVPTFLASFPTTYQASPLHHLHFATVVLLSHSPPTLIAGLRLAFTLFDHSNSLDTTTDTLVEFAFHQDGFR